MAAAYRRQVPTFSAEISAVATGRKPLFHEDLGLLNQAQLAEAAAGLQRQVPAGIEVRLQDGHLYIYDPTLLGEVADPDIPLFDQVMANRDNGIWLGYGVNRHEPGADYVTVVVKDAYGREVGGFSAPTHQADEFARIRMRDWSDATGSRYSYTIIGRPPA